MKTGIYYDLSFKDYVSSEGMNASRLKTVYSDDCARLSQPVSDQTKKGAALRLGTLAHMALLEPELMKGSKNVLPDMEFRSNDAKALKAAHIEKFGVYDFLYHDEAVSISKMGNALRSKPDSDIAAMLSAMESGALKSEASVFAEMEGRKVKCRFDLVGAGMGLDYKTTVSAKPSDFIKQSINMGYDLQAAWYMDCYELATGKALDSFAFLAQEKTPNYLFCLIEFKADSLFIEKGRKKYIKALQKYDAYQEFGVTCYDGTVLDGESLLPGWYQ